MFTVLSRAPTTNMFYTMWSNPRWITLLQARHAITLFYNLLFFLRILCHSEYLANIYQSRALSIFLYSLPSESRDAAMFESLDV